MGLTTAMGRFSFCSTASSQHKLQQEGKDGSRKLYPYPSTPRPPILLSLQIKRLAPHLGSVSTLPTQAQTYQGGVGEGELPGVWGRDVWPRAVRVGWEGGWLKF